MKHLLRNYPLAISKTSLDSLLAGKEEQPTSKPMESFDGVAVVPLLGFIDCNNIAMFKRDFLMALRNKLVSKIVIYVDSQGGETLGADELSNLIYESRGTKRIEAVVRVACSAAYWIASAAHEVILEGKSSMVGSIGVIAIHEDISKQLEKDGVVRTEIFAGSLKTATTENAALSDAGKKELKERVDYFYRLFTNTVARNRGLKIGQVDKTAKIFVGREAITNKLADKIMNERNEDMDVQELLNEIELLKKQNQELLDKLELLQKPKEEEEPVAEEEPIKEEEEEPVAEEEPIEEEEKKEDAVAKALAKERQRIHALDQISIRGYEKVIQDAKLRGTSPEAVSHTILLSMSKKGHRVDALKSESVYLPTNSYTSVDRDAEKERKALVSMIANAGNINRKK
jgi:signal peptide peptidase SppA